MEHDLEYWLIGLYFDCNECSNSISYRFSSLG